MKRPSILFTILSAALLSGCVHPAQTRFRNEYDCPDTQFKELGAGAVRVSGCGRVVTYACGSGSCVTEQSRDERRRSKSTSAGNVRSGTAGLEPRVKRTKHRDGYVLLEASAKFTDEAAWITVAGAPSRDAQYVLLVISRLGAMRELESCELRFSVDGAPAVLPEVHYKAKGAVEEFRMKFPTSQLGELIRAQRVVGQACDARFEMGEGATAALREFAMRFQEELALNGTTTPANAGPAPSDSL